MATKFISLDEAAKMLGMSVDELSELRKKGEIHGLRDGSSWKFKPEELARAAEERGITLHESGGADDAETDFEAPTMDVGGTSDLDLSLEGREVDGAPTAIGTAADLEGLLGGSDVALGGDAEAKPGKAAKGPAKKPAPKTDVGGAGGGESGGQQGGEGSAVDFDMDSGSAVNLGGESSADVLSGSDVGPKRGTAGTGELDFEGSDLGLGSDLSLNDEQELALGPDKKSAGGDDELALGDEEELVLDGGSDVTRGAGDTGINLISSSDSGLNLEEVPLDLAGSSVSSLELPEDDEVQLDELEAGPDEATKLHADEEFQLEPSGGTEEDAEDSGSQVIALEDSEAFAPTAAAAPGEEAILGGAEEGMEEAFAAEEAQPVTAGTAMVYAPLPEMPYSVWNVLTLLAILVVLTVTGMLMTDLLRNMWSWDQTYAATTPIMDAFVKMFGFEP